MAKIETLTPPVKAVKNLPTDHIGAPLQPFLGTGEGLKDYELFTIDIEMANRQSTTRQGVEGYAKSVQIVKFRQSGKNSEQSILFQNKHVGGCILASPGIPNHCTWWFPKGAVKAGQRFKADSAITGGAGHATTETKELVIYTDQPID